MAVDRFQLTGKVAMITGAGRGIGAGCARTFAEAGADVVCAARSVEQIEAVRDQIRALGRRSIAVPCDVMDRAQLEELVRRAQDELGGIDVLVNNAGGFPPVPALRTSERAFEEAFRFNVTSAFLLSRFVIPRMLESGRDGTIVNISSAAGRIAQPGFVAYGTAKAALSFMTRQLAAEFAPRVRINALAVGPVETSALLSLIDEEGRARMENATPMKRLGQVEDVALAALYLASPASAWITGKILEVDGGAESHGWQG